MNLPAAIEGEVEEALTATGGGSVTRSAPVGGGCISPAARIDTAEGAQYFLKWADRSAPQDFFRSQARGLEAMADTNTVRVPRVIASADDWLLLEWLAPGAARTDTWTGLAIQLVGLHRRTGRAFGWDSNNYIGSLPQPNETRNSWPAFWADQRIGPQWELACAAGYFGRADQSDFEKLLSVLDDALAPGDEDGPSLVHGDLWGGNVHVMAGGEAALIDPATYFGHREVDLAMAEMFGGFDRSFHVRYREEWPLHPGYDEERRDLYQLYFQLVHVNLFGHGYVGGVRRVLKRYRG